MRLRWIVFAFLPACGATERPLPPPGAPLPALGEVLPEPAPGERTLSLAAAADAAARLIQARETDGSLERAIALLRAHWTRHSDSPAVNALLLEAHTRLADRLDPAKHKENADRAKRHRDAAAFHAGAALRSDPNCGPAHYWFGQLLLLLADVEQSYGRLKEALSHLEKAEASVPDIDCAGPARMIGRVYQETPGWPMMGDREKALGYYEKAVRRAPESFLNRLWMAEVCVRLKKVDEARRQIRAILDAAPRPDHVKEDRGTQDEARELEKKLPAS